jgi:hypothetical protein
MRTRFVWLPEQSPVSIMGTSRLGCDDGTKGTSSSCRSSTRNRLSIRMSPSVTMKFRQLYPAFLEWAREIQHRDPRHQILAFFNDVAQSGADSLNCQIHETGVCTHRCFYDGRESEYSVEITRRLSRRSSFSESQASLLGNLGGCFDRAGIFTVWRPCSLAAIRKMIAGEGVGKGLDIKGKSAKSGKLSAFVPVLQLTTEKHKRMLRTVPKDAVMRIFYSSRQARKVAQETLQKVMDEMVAGDAAAKLFLSQWSLRDSDEPSTPEQDRIREESLSRYMWEMEDPTITKIDQYAFSNRFGLHIPQRLFLEAYIVRGDCWREPGSEHDIGRPSQPAFQDMNLESLRSKPKTTKYKMKKSSLASSWDVRTVAFQYNPKPEMAMDPKDLVMAYEEQGRVLPVVSDFDCFLIGTRRVKFREPMPKDQLNMMQWSVDNIEKVLATTAVQQATFNTKYKRNSGSLRNSLRGSNNLRSSITNMDTWTMRWLDILKEERIQHGFKPSIPKYGYADPKSYSIMAHAVDRLSTNGAVRHGAECFNYYFPQELDEEFLVISNSSNGQGKWVTYTAPQLLDFLSTKIDEGFMFPLNPKWILCDPGWKKLYDKQIRSPSRAVRKSLDAWYPPKSGIRKRIEQVHHKYPCGFVQPLRSINMHRSHIDTRKEYSPLRLSISQNQPPDVNLALLELEHHDVLRKVRTAVRAIVAANRLNAKNKKPVYIPPAAVKTLMVGDYVYAAEQNNNQVPSSSCVVM